MKILKFFLFWVGIVGFFGGCVAVSHNIQRSKVVTTANTQPSNIKNYKIGSQRKEYVGSPLVKSENLLINKTTKKYIHHNSFEASKDITTLDGKIAIKKGEWASASSYSQEDGYDTMINIPCFYNENSYCQYNFYHKNGINIQKPDDKIKLLNTIDIIRIPENRERLIEEETEILKGSLSHELIYNGKDGNNIKISYREYKDDMARLAFFQDLTYNLKESDIIRYKNYRIKVHKATNEEISYTVLED